MEPAAPQTISAEHLLALKQRKLQLLQKKVGLRKDFGLAFYKPFPKQTAFHSAGDFKRRLVRAGNRFGKSFLGCAEDCSFLLGHRPWIPESDPLCRLGIPQHPTKGLVITTDWDKVDEIFTSERGESGKLWRLLPKGFVKSKRRNHSGAIDTIECQNGSVLRFDTVKSWLANPQGSESSDWDFIHVDEPCPQGMWTGSSRGLIDRHGSAWFTLTPLKEPWITDFFDTSKPLEGSTDRWSWAETGSIYDNIYLSREAIHDFERTLTDEEKQCRLHGLPLHLAGLVYKEFSQDKHVLKDVPQGWANYQSPPANYTIYYAIDPHPQTPHAVLFLAVSPLGQIFLYDEIFNHCTIRELAEQIKAKLGSLFVAHAKVDPLAYINDPITDSNMAEEFANHGVYLEKATKALSQGILCVKDKLKRGDNLYFSPALTRTLWEIKRWSWDTKDNKPVDKDDHMLECLYRLLLDEPVYMDLEKLNGENPTSEPDFTDANLNDDLSVVDAEY